MAISFFGILLIMGVIGFAVIGLFAMALAKGRGGLAVLLGGLALLFGIPIISIIAALFAFKFSTKSSLPFNSLPATPDAIQQQWTEYHTVSNTPTWSIALTPLLFMAVAFLALLILLARRGMGHTTTGGRGKIWPVFLAVPVLAIFMLGGLRIERSRSISTTTQNIPAAQIQHQIHEQQVSLKKSQAELARQQAALAKQAASLAESLHKQIDQMDIHELMDKFDAPRIALKMPITPSPAALVIAAANAATGKSKSDATVSGDTADDRSSRPAARVSVSSPESAIKIASTDENHQPVTKMTMRLERPNKLEMVMDGGTMAMTVASNGKELKQLDDARSTNQAIAESEDPHVSSEANDERKEKPTEPAAVQTAEQPADKRADATAVVEAEAPATPAPPAPPAPAAAPPTAAPPVAAAPASTAPRAGNSARPVAAAQPAATSTSEASPTPPAPEREHQAASTTPPSWINEPPKRMGDVRREVIVTDLYESDEECYQAADIYLMLRTYERLQQLQGQPLVTAKLPSISFGSDAIKADGDVVAVGRSPIAWFDHRFVQLSSMGIGADYLRREIVAKNPGNNQPREYLETVQQSFGPMKKLYMQIEFTPAVDRELMQRREGLARQERFAQVGVGAGSVLGLLLTMWGLLRLDTATKGYYSKWLFLGVPAAIIAGIAFCAADPFHMF